ncbi:hypothetical protein J6590_016805 [Homalodisca vitripennis]|nr:hypothetical protein J6590_016805 [Homalodisca vitripennis]
MATGTKGTVPENIVQKQFHYPIEQILPNIYCNRSWCFGYNLRPRSKLGLEALLTLNLGTNGLKVTSEPPPMTGQAGRLQGQDRSAVTCPSSSHARRCLICGRPWRPEREPAASGVTVAVSASAARQFTSVRRAGG